MSYQYAVGTISKFHIRSPQEVTIFVSLTDEKGPLTQKVRTTYAKWVMAEAGVGTSVRVRANLSIPYLLRTWEFVDFL